MQPVPFWGQTTQTISCRPPERDCGPKRVFNPGLVIFCVCYQEASPSPTHRVRFPKSSLATGRGCAIRLPPSTSERKLTRTPRPLQPKPSLSWTGPYKVLAVVVELLYLVLPFDMPGTDVLADAVRLQRCKRPCAISPRSVATCRSVF